MDVASVVDRVTRVWDDDVLPTITEYIRIPDLSPAFDRQWAEHGHIDRAVDLVSDGMRARPIADRIGEPDLVVCLDSGCATWDRLWLTTSLRGLIAVTLTVRVLDEGVHSGAAGGVVPSTFRIVRELLSRIEDETTGELLVPE